VRPKACSVCALVASGTEHSAQSGESFETITGRGPHSSKRLVVQPR
jgi:hypothetical protein